VVGNECCHSKPHPAPYLKAIELLNTKPERCFIFEDSKTGILSAINSKALKIIGIETNSNSVYLKKYGANITIKDYLDPNLYRKIIQTETQNHQSNLDQFIINSIPVKIDQAIIDNSCLKGGYICDVIGVKLIIEKEEINCVLKKENQNESILSEMATKLDLYEREYYFYESISNYVNVCIPSFFGIVRNDEFNKIGFLMEKLEGTDFILNLNLNKESIDTVLNIISHIASMHEQFMNKNLTTKFRYLKKNNDYKFIPDFISDKIDIFVQKWKFILSDYHIRCLNLIATKYHLILNALSTGSNLTLCHGDVKSANMFFKKNGTNYTPYFIDWQYIVEGKGVQDIVFFMIESFEIDRINSIYPILIHYYYDKISKNFNYPPNEYHNDINYAIAYFPTLVAIWFGTIDMSELNDKNFPFFFIKKYLNFLDKHFDINVIENLN
jgi:thiamine kinase-like enzyme